MMSIKFNLLQKFPGIRHGILTRHNGTSVRKYRSLNLSYKCGDQADNVNENRKIVANTFRVDPQNLLFPDQCHTNNVKVVIDNSQDLTETDALVTNKQGIAIGVLAADCVPVLFFDGNNNVVGVAHAGWRGTTTRITQKVILKMQDAFDSNLNDIFIGIGPCIQPENYEVGMDVAERVESLGHMIAKNCIRKAHTSNKVLVDLQQINRMLLLESGVPDTNIEILRMCTFKEKNSFFSARRDGFETGRFGAVITIV